MLNKSSLEYIDDIKEKVNSPKKVELLTEDMMWETHGPLIWQADQFDGKPFFYPVYRYKNFYSYSQLALILKKKKLVLNRNAYEKAGSADFAALSHEQLIDVEIERLGAPYSSTNEITDSDDYCAKIVNALKDDIADIEEKNPGHTNVVMCGGKDSLNLLLLPWRNPVIAVSAEPNYPLVCEFVEHNGLDIDVLRLSDDVTDGFLKREIAELCCRFNAVHWRWGQHLNKISEMFDRKVVIWKGQMGDLYMSTRWKTYTYGKNNLYTFLCKIYGKISPYLPPVLNEIGAKIILPGVEQRVWKYGANAQGAHVGFIRAITGCLVLSAYHGKRMSKILKSADLGKVAQKDIRDEIGEALLGRKVIYPRKNPAPRISDKRLGLHNPELFVDLLESNDIEIINSRD